MIPARFPAREWGRVERRDRLVGFLTAFAVGLLLGWSARGQTSSQPPRVLGQLRQTSAFVGQPVDLVVGVVAGRQRPFVSPPRIEGAELDYLRTELVPMNLSAIGDMIADQNLYRFRYRLIPTRIGRLTIPPFAATVGAERGLGPSLRLTVHPLPRAGRPAVFLGGVGAFEVDAKATPATIQAGGEIEYRVTISGPGSRGVNTAPDLSEMESLPIAPTVERQPDLVDPGVPSRQFVVRVRPTRPGEVTLPPLRIAAFDPVANVYITKVAPGARVKVVEPPPFDLSSVEYAPRAATTEDRAIPSRWGLAIGALVAVFLALATAWRIARGDRRGSILRGLARQSRRVATARSESEAGRRITEGLVEYLRRANDRPAGALTPEEARAGVGKVTGSDVLAEEAAALMTSCDRARFGDARQDAPALIASGIALFRALSKASLGRTRGRGFPADSR